MRWWLGLGLAVPPSGARLAVQQRLAPRWSWAVVCGGLLSVGVALSAAWQLQLDELYLSCLLAVLGVDVPPVDLAPALHRLRWAGVVGVGPLLLVGLWRGKLALGRLGEVVRRARAFWRDPRGVRGPEDVYARMMCTPHGLELVAVEGFVAFATLEEWPLQVRVVRGWLAMQQAAVDQALLEGRRWVHVGTERCEAVDAAVRLAQVGRSLGRTG